jgi:hypothetical protein
MIPLRSLLSSLSVEPAALRSFLVEAGVLLPTEDLEDLPRRWLPEDDSETELLYAAVALHGLSNDATQPYRAHWEAEVEEKKPRKTGKAVQRELITDGPEPMTCGGLCVLTRWSGRRFPSKKT